MTCFSILISSSADSSNNLKYDHMTSSRMNIIRLNILRSEWSYEMQLSELFDVLRLPSRPTRSGIVITICFGYPWSFYNARPTRILKKWLIPPSLTSSSSMTKAQLCISGIEIWSPKSAVKDQIRACWINTQLDFQWDFPSNRSINASLSMIVSIPSTCFLITFMKFIGKIDAFLPKIVFK